MSKILSIIILFLIEFQIVQNEKFEMEKLKINAVSVGHINKSTLIKMFGKPLKISLETNEFTGELFSIYTYNGIVFEVTKNQVLLSEISSKNWIVSYNGIEIGIGKSMKNLKKLFPNSFRNKNCKYCQIDIPINKTNASYFQLLIENENIKAISVSENY